MRGFGLGYCIGMCFVFQLLAGCATNQGSAPIVQAERIRNLPSPKSTKIPYATKSAQPQQNDETVVGQYVEDEPQAVSSSVLEPEVVEPEPIETNTTEAAASKPLESAPPGANEYLVQPKDTMYSLSNRFGVTIDRLLKYNNMQSAADLKAGQILKIPSKQ